MVEFVVRRLEQVLVDGGVSVEAVRAALQERSANPCLAASTARDLQARRAVFVSSLHFDRLPDQFCRLLERLAGNYIEH